MKKIITETDIEKIAEKGQIIISDDMVMTPLARDYASRKGIRIMYGSQKVPEASSMKYDKTAPDDKLIATVTEEVMKAIQTDQSRECLSCVPEHDSGSSIPSEQSIRLPEQSPETEIKQISARAVVTSTGMNKTGIAARITTIISECGCDIVDISQTIVSDFFTMIIVVNIEGLRSKGMNFREFKAKIEDVSKELGIETMVMHEDILKAMHRP
jgi:ACT domain-containing protein